MSDSPEGLDSSTTPVGSTPTQGTEGRRVPHQSAEGSEAAAGDDKGILRGRRKFLVGAGAAIAAGLTAAVATRRQVASAGAEVFVAKADSYAADLVTPLREGLTALGLGPASIKGKTILLKPNLVEPFREAPHINTHPAVVAAAADVFRSWDAARVFVAEGQGHTRDTYLVLDQSGMGPMLKEAKLDFIDLNHDDVFRTPDLLNLTGLGELVLPATLRGVDLVVSMPKLKTHHWAGVTLSMKNLFGVMPGIYYGWPKNVLHVHDIGRSILDINATVRPGLAIIDGIVGMEGDGPIMGTPRKAGVLVMGTNLPAVDATGARLMRINPERIGYLSQASQLGLGPIASASIEQRGELLAPLAQPFQLLDHPMFEGLRA